MKNVTSLDFVTKAISKDTTRYNLNAVYRDTDCLVATDGHRLHWASGQTKIDKGHYLNGLDAEFPDWRQCLPQGEPTKIEIPLDTQIVKALRAMKAFMLAAGCDFNLSTEFNHSGSKLTILGYYCGHECKMVLPSNSEKPFKVLLNLGYFIDAIELYVSSTKLPIVTGEYYGALLAMIFSHGLGKAMIMPLRA